MVGAYFIYNGLNDLGQAGFKVSMYEHYAYGSVELITGISLFTFGYQTLKAYVKKNYNAKNLKS
jgi:hypothetical protein